MTDQEIREVIAEDQGWKWYRRPAQGPWASKPHRALYHPLLHADYTKELTLADMTERQCNKEFIWREGFIPDYPNDLNAMHEVLGTLESRFWSTFLRELAKATKTDLDINSLVSVVLQVNATARQRAEAYLRTKGLWKE